jgi:hypothetical protein
MTVKRLKSVVLVTAWVGEYTWGMHGQDRSRYETVLEKLLGEGTF